MKILPKYVYSHTLWLSHLEIYQNLNLTCHSLKIVYADNQLTIVLRYLDAQMSTFS